MKSEPILRFEGIIKQFPGVVALKGVNFELREGEVHVLVGANGAGKSTLVKILAGVYQPDAGRIIFDGKPVTMKTPEQAFEMGISIVYQNFNLIGKMDIGQNIFLNREPLKGRLIRRIDWERIYSETQSVLERLHVNIDPKSKIDDLPVADLQMVEIAKALAVQSRILVLDEPTSSLSGQETDELFSRISQLKEEGVAILYISHRLEEIKRIGDRVTVFRDGEGMGSGNIEDMSVQKIIKMMLGRDIKKIYPWRARETGEEILSVNNLASSNAFSDISFSLRTGEILGISGLVGAKRTELAHAIFGALPIGSGQVRFKGRTVEFRSPKDAIHAGIGLLPEDKAKHGMFEILSVASNVTSAGLKLLKKGLGLDLNKEKGVVEEYKEKLNIMTPSTKTQIESLSGGNQQKVVLAKSLFTNSEVLIFDEPTKGIDVGAKEEIYNLMIELAGNGKGIIMISSELPEILGMSDRILVMKEGRVTAEMSREEANQEKLLEAAL
ncbi:MAG: ribose transport system ATP-binding protein [Thermodesulfobacteriota bacterium]|nr:ribose transport system ATP-binding protein [Thermodesulfobacteriota bacterium]